PLARHAALPAPSRPLRPEINHPTPFAGAPVRGGAPPFRVGLEPPPPGPCAAGSISMARARCPGVRGLGPAPNPACEAAVGPVHHQEVPWAPAPSAHPWAAAAR